MRFVDVRSHDSLIITAESQVGSLKLSVNSDDIETASDIL